jgi:hypothetical protein
MLYLLARHGVMTREGLLTCMLTVTVLATTGFPYTSTINRHVPNTTGSMAESVRVSKYISVSCCTCRKCLKVPKRLSETMNRRTDNTMVKRKRTKKQRMIYKKGLKIPKR